MFLKAIWKTGCLDITRHIDQVFMDETANYALQTICNAVLVSLLFNMYSEVFSIIFTSFNLIQEYCWSLREQRFNCVNVKLLLGNMIHKS